MEITSRNWLITGGCGFLGVNLIDRLLKLDPKTNIRVLDNLSVGSRDDLGGVCNFREVASGEIGSSPSGVELVVSNIMDVGACSAATKGIDVVVHFAANTGVGPSVENPRLDMETNVIGTFNMLEASRQNNVRNFIFASSGAPLGEVEPPIHEEKAPRPVSPYGASKLAGEGYCSAFYRTFGLKTVSLRFGNVYGPRSKHKSSVVAKFFRQALRGEPLEIYGDGSQTRDFIYIDDLVQAVILSVKSDIGGEVFQIATHRETDVNEIAMKIKELLKNEAGIQVGISYSAPRLGDVKRNYSDISKARRMLHFEPECGLENGLRLTWQYFKEQSR